MAELQQDRTGGGEPPGRRREERGPVSHEHVAVGYTDRSQLDDFIGGEAGDLVIHGPIHAGERVREVETLGPGVTQGTPCLVVPLIRERIDEIQREVTDVLDRFQAQRGGGGEVGAEGGEGGRRAGGPRTIGETGGTARGASSGAIREGSIGGSGS